MGKIAVITLRRCAPCHPAFFCIAISNGSKFRGEILSNSTLGQKYWFIAPERTAFVDYTWRFPVRHIPDYFSYHQQSGVIFCSAAHTGLQWRNVSNIPIRYKNRDAPM